MRALRLVVLEVVGGHEVLLVAGGRQEVPGPGVVAAVGQELQGQERVSGPTLPEVQLDRVRAPLPPLAGTTTKSTANRPITPRSQVVRPTLSLALRSSASKPESAGKTHPR